MLLLCDAIVDEGWTLWVLELLQDVLGLRAGLKGEGRRREGQFVGLLAFLFGVRGGGELRYRVLEKIFMLVHYICGVGCDI